MRISIKKTVSVLILVLLIAILIRLFVGEPCCVPSDSMEPTILSGDWLWINKATFGCRLPKRWAEIPLINLFTNISVLRNADAKNNWGYHRLIGFRHPIIGDIIVFNSPENKEVLLVKRVAEIYYKGDSVRFNKENFNLVSQNFKNENISIDAINDIFCKKYALTQNYYFVLGDNQGNSRDSRYFGFIPENLIVGKVSRGIFSIEKISESKFKFRKKRLFFKLE